jgi:hypothetical protein
MFLQRVTSGLHSETESYVVSLTKTTSCILHWHILLVSSLPNFKSPHTNNIFMIYYIMIYGCETRSLTLMEEHRLRVFENRVLRRVSGPKRDEVTGEWRKLHNEELRDLYSLPSIIRIIKSCVRVCVCVCVCV